MRAGDIAMRRASRRLWLTAFTLAFASFACGLPIDNRAGAGGVVGSELAARASPDGHTVISEMSGSHAINATLHPRLPYDPVKDFAPVTLVARGANILVVHPALPVSSVKDLVALARSNRGRMNFASAGSGATSHLAGEMFKLHSGAPITHVPV